MTIIILLALTAIISLFLGFYTNSKNIQYVALLGVLSAFILSFMPECASFYNYSNLYLFDNSCKLFTQIALLIVLLIFLLSNYAFRLQENIRPELYALMLFSLSGLIIMIGSKNLISLFIGLEVLSIPLYALAGSNKNDLRSNEASLKYFLMGAFATGFLLLGITFIYGASTSFNFEVIANYATTLLEGNNTSSMLWYGMVLMGVGILFKIAIVPFHFWSPDVYQGAPSIITMFMATTVKIAGFITLYNLISTIFYTQLPQIQIALSFLIIITLISSNLMGLIQKNAKRLLAFSSISHAGYLLLFFFGIHSVTIYNIALYLLAYGLATIGTFMTVIYVERQTAGYSDINYFNGLAKKEPLLALATTVSLLSMAGIPLTAGFIAKLSLFRQSIQENLILILIAVIGSAISIVYYLRIIIAMYYKKEAKPIFKENAPVIYRIVAVIIIILLISLGLFIRPVYSLVSSYFQ